MKVLLLFPIGSLVVAQDCQIEKLASCKPQDYDGCNVEMFTVQPQCLKTTLKDASVGWWIHQLSCAYHPLSYLSTAWYFALPCLASGQITDPGICNKAGDKEADCVASKCTWISRQDKSNFK